MSNHASMPALCKACHAVLLEKAAEDPRPYLIRWCEHRRTLAFAFRRGSTSITHWELFSVPSDDEYKLYANRIAEIVTSGQTALGKNDPLRRGH